MRVQKAVNPETSKESWLVIGEDFLPVTPIQDYLTYLTNIERSPNTVRTYAYHLRLYWEYLAEKRIDWKAVKLETLADFILWLRSPDPAGVISMLEQEAKRSEASINGILTCVCMFYDFHERDGTAPHIPLYRTQVMPGRRYKGFLHHITKGKPVKTRLLKLKVPKRTPKTIPSAQVQELASACTRVRDKFLICLLHESGMRIGQALGLRHEDIHSMDNLICIEPRDDNANGARSKSKDPYTLH
ncbi:MAG: site-specific integrase, partial [Cyanobacteria bacterium J06555_13]